MKIVVDAMGGDYAPGSVVDGVVDALHDFQGFDIILVGNLEQLSPLRKQYALDKNQRIELVHADQTVKMDDSSTSSIREKKKSSITVGATIARTRNADALVTIGHTGAAVAATKIKMRTLPGVDRPAIAVRMPAHDGQVILLDAGANVDCKPKHLAQFAVMGELFAKLTLDISKPKVGLLNVGDEDVKGNELTKEAFKMMLDMPINFIGNIEGTDIFQRKADVVVCDGFVGNVVLKACEGLSRMAMQMLKKNFTKNPFRLTTALLAKKPLEELKKLADSEEYGGAPLLGLNGICIIGHGSSSPKGVKNAIKVAAELVRRDLNGAIVEKLQRSKITF